MPTDHQAPAPGDAGPAMPQEFDETWAVLVRSRTWPDGQFSRYLFPRDGVSAFPSKDAAEQARDQMVAWIHKDILRTDVEPVLIGVSPVRLESAEKQRDDLADILREVSTRLDYLRNLWGDEAITRRIADRISAALGGLPPGSEANDG